MQFDKYLFILRVIQVQRRILLIHDGDSLQHHVMAIGGRPIRQLDDSVKRIEERAVNDITTHIYCKIREKLNTS